VTGKRFRPNSRRRPPRFPPRVAFVFCAHRFCAIVAASACFFRNCLLCSAPARIHFLPEPIGNVAHLTFCMRDGRRATLPHDIAFVTLSHAHVSVRVGFLQGVPYFAT